MIAGAKVTFIVEIARRQDRGRDLFVSKWKNSYSFSVFSSPSPLFSFRNSSK